MTDTAQIDDPKVQDQKTAVHDQKTAEEARRNEEIPRWAVRGRTDTARGRTDTARGRTDTARGRTDTARGRTDTARGRTDTARGFGLGGPYTDRAVGDIFHAAASLGGHLIVAVVSPICASIPNCNSAPGVSYSALSADDAASLARLKRLEFERVFLETNTKR